MYTHGYMTSLCSAKGKNKPLDVEQMKGMLSMHHVREPTPDGSEPAEQIVMACSIYLRECVVRHGGCRGRRRLFSPR